MKRPVPPVEDLLPLGRTVAQELAAEGRPLTRDNLLTAIRRVGTVSTARATALLAVLKAEAAAGPQQGSLALVGSDGGDR